MAKVWGNDSAAKLAQRNQYSAVVNNKLAAAYSRQNVKPKPGIKVRVIEIYIEKGKLAAWQELQEYNKKISGGGFTLEILEQWIREYENRRTQKAGKDDGHDR